MVCGCFLRGVHLDTFILNNTRVPALKLVIWLLKDTLPYHLPNVHAPDPCISADWNIYALSACYSTLYREKKPLKFSYEQHGVPFASMAYSIDLSELRRCYRLSDELCMKCMTFCFNLGKCIEINVISFHVSGFLVKSNAWLLPQMTNPTSHGCRERHRHTKDCLPRIFAVLWELESHLHPDIRPSALPQAQFHFNMSLYQGCGRQRHEVLLLCSLNNPLSRRVYLSSRLRRRR